MGEVSDFPRRVRVFFIIIVGLMAIGTLGFKILNGLSFQQSFIYTLESLAFMFHDDIGIGKSLEIFLAIVGSFSLWWVLWSFADLLLEGKLGEYLKSKTFSLKVNNMKNHFLIGGGGRVGEEIARELSKKKKPYIIIEKDEATVKKLDKKGLVVMQGDVLDEGVLKEVGVQNAKAIFLTLPQTEKNLLVTITIKDIAPEIEVYARADNPSYVSKLKKAGAKAVIVPEVIAADKLVEEMDA